MDWGIAFLIAVVSAYIGFGFGLMAKSHGKNFEK